ncbi:metal ABC transporter substrate-binding protein [Aneurinibacillus tyrosinisolvens]|uniref:metal ABC transporter substrate-binding protein n=1 Tax=Aneurinibacillus tyrosinisolvens TaxID=1443435 RepID=UPI00063F940E|nr:metal ABC transporter substrate-binding protein [Aneurinibacillus tyrosinisolvens]
MVGYRRIFFSALALSLLIMVLLAGCGNNDSGQPAQQKNGKVLIYTSLFPIYDFARTIGGDYVIVNSIIPPGAEPHDFEPSPKDMAQLSKANLFIYNGAGYETWIEKAIQNLDTAKTKPIDASQGVRLLTLEQEMADEHSTDHHEHGQMHDPHIWLDPVRAKQQAETIQKALSEVDPAHKADYEANYSKLAAQLDSLDQDFKTTLAGAQKKEFVTSHRAFAYLAEHYGLKQIAVSGLSPSEEPSQQDLTNLVDTVKKHHIKYVAFEELVQSKVAQAVQREAGAEAILLNPVENVTKEQLASGKTYVDLMKANLETLKKMLEVK